MTFENVKWVPFPILNFAQDKNMNATSAARCAEEEEEEEDDGEAADMEGLVSPSCPHQ